MRTGGKTLAVASTCVVAVTATVILLLRFSDSETSFQEITEEDLSKDSVYQKYQFGHNDHVIDVGIQPLWIPANMITETMSRDRVLKDGLARDGFEIRFHNFRKGADVNYFLSRDDLEVGVGGDLPALTAAVKSNVVITSVVQRGSCAIVSDRYMLSNDLKGLNIAFAFGSLSHYMLLRLLSSSDIAREDVHLVTMNIGEMPSALARGDIDAFAAWEPTPTVALNQIPGATVIHRSSSSGYLYFSHQFAKNHPEALRQIVAAQIRAMRWLRQNRENLQAASRWSMEKWKVMTGETIPLSQETITHLALQDIIGLTSFPEISDDELAINSPLEEELEFIKELGLVSTDATWEELRKRFNTTMVSEIVSNGKEYQLNTFRYIEQE